MDDAIIKQIKETIRDTVNGKIDTISRKIDDHNLSHEADMQRILPVLEAYETAQKGGKAIMWTGGAITILGGAWLVLKQIFPNI